MRKFPRLLVISGSKVSFIGRKYAILLNTPATIGCSFRDRGWIGAELLRHLGPIYVWSRVD